MAGAGINLLRAAVFHKRLGRAAEGPGSIHHIIQKNDRLALHVADDIHDLGLTKVGKKTKLKYVVADKNVQIKEVKEVVGEEDHYTYISFGANI